MILNVTPDEYAELKEAERRSYGTHLDHVTPILRRWGAPHMHVSYEVVVRRDGLIGDFQFMKSYPRVQEKE